MIDNNKLWNDGAYLKAAVLELETRKIADRTLEHVDMAEQYLKWAVVFADKTGTYDFTLGELEMLVEMCDQIAACLDHIKDIVSETKSVMNTRGREHYLRTSEERKKISEMHNAATTSNDPTQTAE